MKIRHTPLLWVSSISLLFAIPNSLNYLFFENNGGKALGGAILAIFSIITLLSVFIEQFIIYKVNPRNKTIWVIEILILLGLVLSFVIYHN